MPLDGARTPRRTRRWRAPLLQLAALGAVLALLVVPGGGSVPVRTLNAAPVSLTDPEPPTNVRVTKVEDKKLTVAWDASTETYASGYDVFVDDVEVQSNLSSSTRSTVLSSLVNGRSYKIQVGTDTYTFVTGTNDGQRRSPAIYGVPRDAVPPAAPTGLSAAARDRAVDLSWTAPSDNDVNGYVITAVRTDTGASTTTTSTGTSAAITGLVNGVTYRFTVAATDTSGNTGAASSAVTARPFDTVAPGAPTGLTATPGDRQVALSWTAPSAASDYDVASYTVTTVRASDGTAVATTTSTSTSATVTGLVNGTSYRFTVSATDTSGNTGAASAAVTAVPRDTVAPGAPTGVTATGSDRAIALSWTAPTDTDLASYDVLDTTGTVVATVAATTRSATITGLVNGRSYTYRVRATDTSGNTGAASAAVTATPRDTVAPGAPTALTATPGDRQVALSWTAPGAASDYDVASYTVTTVRASDGSAVATTTSTSTSATVTGLVNGTSYRFTVTATDTSGNTGTASSAVTATPRDTAAPGAPTNLTATPGDRQLVLSWTAPSDTDLDRYEVLEGGTVVATVPAGTTTATVTGLANGTPRTYAVRAVDTSGNTGPASATATATPRDTVAPGAPTALTATPGDRQVALSWTAPSAASDYDVASYTVTTVRASDGTAVATTTSTTTSATVPGLVNGTAYRFTVTATDTSGNTGAASAAVTATPRDTVAPGAPTALTATPADRQVALSWTAPTDTDLASYTVTAVRDADGAAVATTTSTSPSATVTGLVNGTAYRFTVTATDTSGNTGAASAAVTATPRDTVAPGAPTGVTATGSDRAVAVSWTAPSDTDLASYDVLDATGTVVATAAATTRSATVTGLVNGRSYTYRVRATDTSGNLGAVSASATAVPRDAVAPGAPTALTATGSDRQVALSWTAPTDTDLDHYEVLDAGGAVLATVQAGTTSYAVTGLVNGQASTYRVRAVDTSGNAGSASDPASATPRDAVPPGTPTGLTATPGDRQLVLSWTAPSDTDLDRYEVLDASGSVIAAVPAGTTSYTATGLVNGQPSTFRVRARDTSGNTGAASAAVTATPRDAIAPGAPTGPSAVPGDRQLVLSWSAPSDADLARYEVLDAADAVVATATAPSTTATLTGLVNGRSGTYRVRAVDTSGNTGAPSSPVTATPRDAVAPAAPTALTATPGDHQVVLSWTAPADTDLERYEVLEGSTVVATVPAGTTTATLTGLADGTPHTYAVRAVDTSANTGPASATATATPRSTTAPAAPTALTATGSDGTVTLTWTRSASPDLAGYRLYRTTAGGSAALVASPAAGDTGYTDSGLVNGTAYSYSLTAVDTSGNESAAGTTGSTATATPRDAVAPAAPTGPAGTGGDTSATITWTAPADTDVASYRVLRADGTTAATATAPTTTATVTGLSGSTSYTFTVVAVDTSGNTGAASVSVTVTTTAAGAPAGGSGQSGALAASRDGRWVVVATTAKLESSDTNTASELYRIDTASGAARRIAPLPASATGTSDPTNASDVAISDDGGYVAFSTTAAMVSADTNRLLDVYRADLTQATTTYALVSVPASGGRVNPSVAGTVLQGGASVYATSPQLAISASGDRVLFYSARPDLVTGDTNGAVDVFAKDMTSGAVTRVSTSAAGGDLPRTATGPALALSADGRWALFTATSSSGPMVVYRKDLSVAASKGAVDVASSVLVSGRSTEVGAYRDTGDVALSDDGRYVVFVTAAKVTSSTPTASGSTGLAYRKDMATGALVALGNGQSTTWEHQVALSPDGRWASFSTAAAEVAGDTNGHTDVYGRQLPVGSETTASGSLVLLTGSPGGTSYAGPTGAVSPSEYGRVIGLAGGTVVVVTLQPLVSGDTNGVRDTYHAAAGASASSLVRGR